MASTQGMNQAICEDYEQSNWQQSTTAIQQLAQSEIAARNCKNLVKGQSVASTNSSAPFNGNCMDPAHYYNSACVNVGLTLAFLSVRELRAFRKPKTTMPTEM